MHIATRYLLNIELRFNIAGRSTGGIITPGAAIHELYGALDKAPVEVLAWHVHGETLVVELGAAPRRLSIDNLATHLWQDCIAVFDLDTWEGDLIGPRADGWLPFDPHKFILPKGLAMVENYPGCPIQLVKELDLAQSVYTPLLTPDTADFSTYEKRCELALKGIYSIDRADHRAKRDRQRAAGLLIDGAYEWLGLDRKRESSRIQSDVAGLLPEGIWPRSSKLYTSRMSALDTHILARAERQGYCS